MLAIISMARHMSISHHLNAMKQDLVVCVGSRLRAEGLNAALTRSPLTLTLNGSCSQFGCSKEACLQYQFIRIFMSLHPTIFVRPGFCKYCTSKLISAAKKWNRQKNVEQHPPGLAALDKLLRKCCQKSSPTYKERSLTSWHKLLHISDLHVWNDEQYLKNTRPQFDAKAQAQEYHWSQEVWCAVPCRSVLSCGHSACKDELGNWNVLSSSTVSCGGERDQYYLNWTSSVLPVLPSAKSLCNMTCWVGKIWQHLVPV